MDSVNYHEENSEFTYLRFPIGDYSFSPFDMKTNTGNVRYFNVFLDFVEKVMEEGRNVLIHCVAGAHRAGTAACAWLLYAHNLSVDDAIKLAHSRRDAIDPRGDKLKDQIKKKKHQNDFPLLLEALRKGLNEKGLLEKIRSSVNVHEDMLAINKAAQS